MKTRESGMPEETTWTEYLAPDRILPKLGLTALCGDVVEFGCGYGTFTIPAARIISGYIYALDIEPTMIATTRKKAKVSGLKNIQVCLRDFMEEGTGRPEASADYVMLFNILHAQFPEVLLRKAIRVLRPRGKVGIVHWNYNENTPRGPSLEIRPRPEQCLQWAESVGFQPLAPGIVDLPPYHYGMVLERTTQIGS